MTSPERSMNSSIRARVFGLSNANLARRLRGEGHTIANRRVSELAEAARDDATRHGV
jgi:hypothetical protein